MKATILFSLEVSSREKKKHISEAENKVEECEVHEITLIEKGIAKRGLVCMRIQ